MNVTLLLNIYLPFLHKWVAIYYYYYYYYYGISNLDIFPRAYKTFELILFYKISFQKYTFYTLYKCKFYIQFYILIFISSYHQYSFLQSLKPSKTHQHNNSLFKATSITTWSQQQDWEKPPSSEPWLITLTYGSAKVETDCRETVPC